jgi:CDP-diglyceride synthetase
MHALPDELQALALLVTANAVPLILAKLAGGYGAAPLDFGCVMPDGERLFGSHKTWRGLIAGTLACMLVAASFGLPLEIGAGFGALSLAADAACSSIKRRMHVRPGTEVLGLDHVAEALLPLLVFAEPLSLDLFEIAAVMLAFVALDRSTRRLRYRQWI